MTKTQPGSETNIIDGLKGDLVKQQAEIHSSIDHLGVPRFLDGKNLTYGERVHLAIEERTRFRREIGALVDECKEYRDRAEKALDIAKATDAAPSVIDSIRLVIDTPKQIPLRQKKRWLRKEKNE